MKRLINDLTEQELRQIIREEVREAMSEIANEAAPQFLDMKQAADYLSLSKSTLYKMVANDKIPVIRQGPKKLVFKRSDLDKWLTENRFLDKNGTAPDGWNEKLQQHVVYEQPDSTWADENWKQK